MTQYKLGNPHRGYVYCEANDVISAWDKCRIDFYNKYKIYVTVTLFEYRSNHPESNLGYNWIPVVIANSSKLWQDDWIPSQTTLLQ